MPYKDREKQREYQKSHYESNKDRYKIAAQKSKDKYREDRKLAYRQGKEKPCADCGMQYDYWVMQYDHIGEKLFTISTQSHSYSVAKILEEIAKCEVVCANCHATRTHLRRINGGSAMWSGTPS